MLKRQDSVSARADLLGRYKIKDALQRSRFGRVYNLIDLEDTARSIQVKFMASLDLLLKEIEIINKLWSSYQIVSREKQENNKSLFLQFFQVIETGIYSPKSKQSFRLIQNKQGELVQEDGSVINAECNKQSFFYISNQFGHSLSHFFNKVSGKKCNMLSVYALGQRLLDLVEIVHRAGFIHNNISLDNIAVGCSQKIIIDGEDSISNCFS